MFEVFLMTALRRFGLLICLVLLFAAPARGACEDEAAAFSAIRAEYTEIWGAMAIHCSRPGICAGQAEQLRGRCKRDARRDFFACVKQCKAETKLGEGCFATCRSGWAAAKRSCSEILSSAVVDCTQDLPICTALRADFAALLLRKDKIDRALFDCARAAGDPDANF